MSQGPVRGIIRFGPFEVEAQAGVLRKGSARIRLQDQPFQVLLALLERPGEVVTREELHQKVWNGEAFGDLDHRLNIAVNKIREVLRDSVESPRFVETLPRRGYRFVATVKSEIAPAIPADSATVGVPQPRWMILAGIIFAIGVTITGLIAWLPPSAPPRLEVHRLTNDNLAKYAPVLSDAERLYYRTQPFTSFHLVQIPTSGGEPAQVPFAVPQGNSYLLLDITPDGQELLIAVFDSGRSDGRLWTMRLADGSSRRVGDLLGRMAKYSPDGTRLAFTSGGIRVPGFLWVASSDGSNPRRLLEVQDLELICPSWSGDGTRIAFGQRRRPTQEQSAWEIGVNGTGLHRLVPGFKGNHLPAGWTPEGSLLLVSAGQFWTVRPRRFFEIRQPAPVQLTTGEPRFFIPLQIIRDGVFRTVGVTELGELQRFDAGAKNWVSHLGGTSATIWYSQDGQRYAYVTHPGAELWVRNVDGSHPVQLTRAPMQAGGTRWSPDGRVLAFSARSAPDQSWNLYLVDSAGGAVRPACPKGCTGMDLAWMPDGKKIVYAAPVNQFSAEEFYLRLLDVATGEVTKFPGSEQLHSPRLSPDGSTLAALAIPANELALYRLSDGVWRRFPNVVSVGWPSWSHDGTAIWYHRRDMIMRYLVRENRLEEICPLNPEEMAGQSLGSWFDLTPNDEPMILRRRDVQQIYALRWNAR